MVQQRPPRQQYQDGSYFKVLAPRIVGAGKSEICSTGQPVGNSSRIFCCSLEVEILRKPLFLLLL